MAKEKYLYRWWDGDQRRQRTFATKVDLQRFKAQRKQTKKPQSAGDSDLTFKDWASLWSQQYCSVERTSKQTREVSAAFRLYLFPRVGDKPLRTIRADDLLELRRSLLQDPVGRFKRPLSPKTVNHILQLAKQVMKAATERRLVTDNPWALVKMVPEPERAMAYWTQDQRDTFLRVVRRTDPDFARLVTVASHTGMRLGELRGLRRYQLDFQQKLIEVSAVEDAFGLREQRTKNGCVGYVPMNEAVFSSLMHLQMAKGDERVFDVSLTRDAVKRLKAHALAAGVPPIRFHDLRHTFASTLAMSGVELFTVQRLMRHKTVEMTQRYAHLAPGHLADAVARIESTRQVREDVSSNQKVRDGSGQVVEMIRGLDAPRGT